MRRFPAAAAVAAVATSLIAPSAILAEQPSSGPSPDGGASPVPATSAQQQADQADIGAGDAGSDLSKDEAAPAAAPLHTAIVRSTPRRASASAGPGATVFMKDFFFSPKTVTINVGESVKWTDKGKAEEGHTATGDTFDSGVLHQGESYTHKFSTAGTFDYICTLHSNMKGTILVRAGSGGGGGNGGGSSGSSANQASGNSGSSGGGSSSSGSSSSGFDSGSGGSSSSSSSGSSGSLPSTGEDVALLALLGLDLLLAGSFVLLRWRRSEPR